MPSERSIASEIQGLETSGVVEQAYRRYLQDVQQRVEEAAFEKERFVRQVKEERDDAERKRVERKQASLDLQTYLKSQISCKTNEMNRLTLERRQDGNTLHILSFFSFSATNNNDIQQVYAPFHHFWVQNRVTAFFVKPKIAKDAMVRSNSRRLSCCK